MLFLFPMRVQHTGQGYSADRSSNRMLAPAAVDEGSDTGESLADAANEIKLRKERVAGSAVNGPFV